MKAATLAQVFPDATVLSRCCGLPCAGDSGGSFAACLFALMAEPDDSSDPFPTQPWSGARLAEEPRAARRDQDPAARLGRHCYDAGETPDGLFYFVMEYIEGTDVQRMMRTQGPFPPEHALAIAAHVCDALAYAHKRGVIHRDIKPAKITRQNPQRTAAASLRGGARGSGAFQRGSPSD